jgi:hypothetical protein
MDKGHVRIEVFIRNFTRRHGHWIGTIIEDGNIQIIEMIIHHRDG